MKTSLYMVMGALWYGSNMSRASRTLREHCTRADFQKRLSCNQYNYSTDYIYKDYLLPQEIGIITKGKGDSVQERMKSATIRFEKSCIEDKWKLKL